MRVATVSTPLDDARAFAASILYASGPMLDALTLACAVSHALDAFPTVPRLLFAADGPETGKTTALDVVALLGQNAWLADATAAALRSKFNEPAIPTLLIDEAQTVWGASGRNAGNPQLGRIAREGYRRSAKLSMSVGRVTEDVPAYCVMAIAGMKTVVPADIRSRCIVFPMTRKPAAMVLRPSQDVETELSGIMVRDNLHAFVRTNVDALRLSVRDMPTLHPKLTDRRRQVWLSILAMADIAGGTWPARALDAFKTLALDASDRPVLTESQRILRDAATYLRDAPAETLWGVTFRDHLRSLDSEEMYAVYSDVTLAKATIKALGPILTINLPDGTNRKGWHAADVLDAADAMMRALEPADVALPAPADPLAN